MSEVPPKKEGAGGAPNPPAGGEGNPEDKNGEGKGTVAYETHQRLLSEKKKEQEARKQAEEKLAALEAEKAEREKKELEAKGQYKEALEKTEAELKKEREQKEALIGSLQESAKRSAILREIGGQVPERAFSLLPLDEITMGADGRPDPASVKAAAQKFEKDFSFAVQKDSTNGGLPNDAPKPGNTKKLTKAEWEKLPLAEMKKRANEVDWTA